MALANRNCDGVAGLRSPRIAHPPTCPADPHVSVRAGQTRKHRYVDALATAVHRGVRSQVDQQLIGSWLPMDTQDWPARPEEDSIERFARDLKQERLRAGVPSVRKLQLLAHVSKSSLSDAERGKNSAGKPSLPTAEVVRAYVTGTGRSKDEADRWVKRRDALSKYLEGIAPRADPLPTLPPGDTPSTPSTLSSKPFRRVLQRLLVSRPRPPVTINWRTIVTGLLLVAMVAAGGTALVDRGGQRPAPNPSSSPTGEPRSVAPISRVLAADGSTLATFQPQMTRNGCIDASAPFFCDYVISEIRQNPAFGKTAGERYVLLRKGGLTIRTSLDAKIQTATQQAILTRTMVSDRVAAVADVVEPGTGLIRAMDVNRIYNDNPLVPDSTTINLAIGGQGGVQAGSTFMIFTLTAALEEGLSLNAQLQCPQRYVSSFPGSGGAPYVAQNVEPGAGTYNLFTATWSSVNTCFVQLEERTGTERPAALAESLGVRAVGGTPLSRGGPFTLGSDRVSPLAMAGAYATYAAHGKYCPPTALVSVTDSAGRAMTIARPACKQVIQPGIADTVTQVLRGVITIGTGREASIGRPVAGKTGTATDYSTAWFIGYVPQLAATVWVGDPEGGARYPLRGVIVGGRGFSKVFGGTIPAPIWGDFMRQALKGQPIKRFDSPDPSVVAGTQVTMPDVRGLTIIRARARLADVGLTGLVVRQEVSSVYPKGTVARASPGSGNSIGLGSSVLLYISAG